MARFDVHLYPGGAGLLLDCQADLLSGLNTRFVVPLLPRSEAPEPARPLNPVFEIEGETYVMATQYAAAIALRELGARVGSLEPHGREIGNALDFLLTGA